MPTRELHIAAFAVVALACVTPAQAQGPYGIGRSATPAEIAGWNIDIDRYGNNLPPGSGSVSHGREVFDQQCAACHGAKGEGGIGDQLVPLHRGFDGLSAAWPPNPNLRGFGAPRINGFGWKAPRPLLGAI
jgi:hypothetical protein